MPRFPLARAARLPVVVVAAAVVVGAAGCRRQAPRRPASSPSGPVSTAPAAGALPADDAAPEAATPGHLVSRAADAMGTRIEIRVWTADDAGANRAMDRALDEIGRLERLMTTWREESDVSRVNAAAGRAPVAVSPETFAVVERAQEFSRLSGGVFDVTFYALKGLWKFDQDMDASPTLPDPRELRRRLALVDYRQLRLDRERRTLFLARPGMRINLGGIAKGYAVDRATAVLRQAGFGDCIVQAGGDLMLSGTKGGRPWQAGIRDPRSGREQYFAVAPLKDRAFSTAGDYERTFFVGGKRYHHIIDPRTGYPATAARSVTILAPDALTADGLDDAVFILGPDRGMELVEQLPDVGAVIVDQDNHVHVSRRLQGVVRILRPPTDGP